MEYRVNYNNRFRRDVTTSNLEEYKLFLNFLNSKISLQVQHWINNAEYKWAAYWNLISIHYKDHASAFEKQNLGLKWKEAFDNGYDIRKEIQNRINSIDVRNVSTGSSEVEIRTKTINEIVRNFTNYFLNLHIPKLEEIVPNLIEKNVLNIMGKFSPKWDNINNKDVLQVISFYNKKFSEIKELWLREASIKSETYNLGLKEFVKNYVKKSILNQINTLSNDLISNITSKNWSFKNNLNSYQIDNFGKTTFHVNEINDYFIKNFTLILKENFKIENYADVETSLINISKSAVRENTSGFKEIDVFLEGTIKLKLGDASITKNLKIKVPNVLFYNPKEEFQSLINDLVTEINDDQIFKVEQTDFLSKEVNNLEQLYDWFKTNGLHSSKLAKLESFRTQFPSFALRDFKVEFINFPVIDDPNDLIVQHRKIKLEFTFNDSIKNTNDKIFSNEIFVFSSKIIDLQKLINFLTKNKPKYLFGEDWLPNTYYENNLPKKIFPKNDEWIKLLKLVSPDGVWHKKNSPSPSNGIFSNEVIEPNLIFYPKFYWTILPASSEASQRIKFNFENQVDWKYSSLNDKYSGWNPSFKKLKESWYGSKSHEVIADSQSLYIQKWIEEKLKLNFSFIQNNYEKLTLFPTINLEDLFENLDELDVIANDLDITYKMEYRKYKDDTIYVYFHFKNLVKNLAPYTVEKPILKKATTEEINQVKNEIDLIHRKSLNQLNKISFSDVNQEKKYLKEFQDLYNDSQKNYFQNEDFLNGFVNTFKLEKILENYKEDTKQIWIKILRSKYNEKVKEIKNLKGASEKEKQKLLEQLDEELLASLSKIKDLNLDYDIIGMLNSVDWNFKKVLNSKVIISKTFKYILASSAGVLALGSIASGASLISLIRSKKKLKKNNLKFKSRKGLILLTSLIGIASTIGSVGLSLFVFVSQGGF